MPQPAATSTNSRSEFPGTLWHAEPPESVLHSLASSANGLTDVEARKRLEVLGPNVLQRARRGGGLRLLWRQINSPLIYVLIAAAALAIGLGKTIDGLVVFAVVVMNTIIGFLQEYRAGRAIEALMDLVPDNTIVIRGGQRMTVPTPQLVPGDVVSIQSGDKVPADLRMLTARNLQIQEAALTGESLAVGKRPAPVAREALLGDRYSMAYSGTLVTTGSALGVVVATGNGTELGRISALLRDTTELETPLTRQLATVAKWLTVAILAISTLLMLIGLVRGYPIADAFIIAITLAVAAIPEGLPAIMTITLAIGVQRMARRRAVVRRLSAVETLGSTTVICSDKTGTLTRNEIVVQRVWTPVASYEVSGVGYNPRGKLSANGEELLVPPADVRELLRAGVLCNDAALQQADGLWSIAGDPTEGALVVAARKAGMHEDILRREWARMSVLPFESERQYMATLHNAPAGAHLIVLKGAPEVIVPRCSRVYGGQSIQPEAVLRDVGAMAASGMRVLAVAVRATADDVSELIEQDVAHDFMLLGFAGMIDAPRAEAKIAIQACHAAGITVKMITGDHPGTACAIGRELGLLAESETALSGSDLARMSDLELGAASERNNVFARVAPEHKLRLVQSLQSHGHVVAMTGDGVNDAPALKQANIGVAMGITGTAVSKEAAGVVLTDDNFASIAAAVEEGRRVYDNLIKSLAFVLPTNLGLALIMVIAVVFFPIVDGHPLVPMTATQILWINLVATVALALPLAFEAMERDVMRRPPRAANAPVLSRFVVVRTVLVALLMAAGAVGLFLYEYSVELARGVAQDVALREAQTMAVTTVIFFQMFYLVNCRSLREPVWRIGLMSNPMVLLGIGTLLILQSAFIYAPFMQNIFSTAALNADALSKAFVAALLVLPLISLEKWVRQRRNVEGVHSCAQSRQ